MLRTGCEVGIRLRDGRCVRALVISPREAFRSRLCADRLHVPIAGAAVCSGGESR